MHFYERYAAYIPFINWVVPAIFSKCGQGFGDYICAFNKINFAAYQGADPLVLDLDGHGLDLTAQNSSSLLYDFDQDGFLEHSGWVGCQQPEIELTPH